MSRSVCGLPANAHTVFYKGTDDIPEVTKINPYWPASRVPLKVGYKILTIEGRRVRNVEKCAELLTYFRAKQSSIEILVSVGPLLSGQTRVLVKADGEKPLQTILDDGSLQGLFLDEEGGDTVRVRDIGPTGIFARAKINKRWVHRSPIFSGIALFLYPSSYRSLKILCSLTLHPEISSWQLTIMKFTL